MAVSQEMRCHCPSTSFIGYLSRRSLCTSSRIAAPLAQCVPRLIGLSQEGSWPTQTPFTTSAVTVQPTEQCVQMFFLMMTSAPDTALPAALALFTEPSCSEPTAASPPAARPERRRKLRRSSPSEARPAAMAENLVRLGSPFLRFVSIAASLLQRLVAIGAVESLHVGAVGAVARLPLFRAGIVGFSIGRRDNRRCGSRGGDSRTASKGADETAAVHAGPALFVSLHLFLLGTA